jgi:FkbM family methyltransferase
VSPGIVDIGARGGADEELLSIAWASRVVCFEPDPSESAVLTAKGDRRWRSFTVLPFAIGGVAGRQQLYVPDDQRAASLLKHNPAMVARFGRANLHETKSTIAVETTTLNALHAAGQLAQIDYLKVDVEGAELDILRAGSDVLQECVALKVECSFLPQRIVQPLAWDVMQHLDQAGFEVVDLQDVHRWRRDNLPPHPYRVRAEMEYSRGQVAQCDAILLRSVSSISGTDQALRLVVLSAALGFFDYAVDVLRSHPALTLEVQRSHGLELEKELRTWSAQRGQSAVRESLKSNIRGLVPLLRAWAGRLPFSSTRSSH